MKEKPGVPTAVNNTQAYSELGKLFVIQAGYHLLIKNIRYLLLFLLLLHLSHLLLHRRQAVSVGNNEFEEGSAEISPFLKNIDTTVLATNIILNTEEKGKLQKSVIFEIDGAKVAIVSYLSLDISKFDNIGALEYVDEVVALSEAVKTLKEQDVSIIIALGHANNEKLFEIATEVEGLDLIINGHKNLYYWNGTTIKDQKMGNLTTITQKTGKRVPIVQSYAYDQGLGKINIKFNRNGEILNYKAEQIPLNYSVPQDLNALQIIKAYNKDITTQGQNMIGETAVILDGNTCKLEECNFGNLITDSMMYYHAVRYQGDHWTDAPIAIIHSQAIISSIAPANRPAAISRAELLSAIQSEGNIVLVEMNGTILKEVLEHSVSDYRFSNPSGRFLQYSGIRVTYDFAEDPRLVEAVVRCQNCNIPQFNPIDDEKKYAVLIPLSLANGGQGYSMLLGLPRQILTHDEAICTSYYISQRSPIYPEVAGRITLLNMDKPNSANALSVTWLLTSILINFFW